MAGKIKVGYLIPAAALERLRALAERDHRSFSGEVAWLIDQEWQRHVPAAGPRRAQRMQRAQRVQRAQQLQRLPRASAEHE